MFVLSKEEKISSFSRDNVLLTTDYEPGYTLDATSINSGLSHTRAALHVIY
jgi:hypothetical protein